MFKTKVGGDEGGGVKGCLNNLKKQTIWCGRSSLTQMAIGMGDTGAVRVTCRSQLRNCFAEIYLT